MSPPWNRALSLLQRLFNSRAIDPKNGNRKKTAVTTRQLNGHCFLCVGLLSWLPYEENIAGIESQEKWLRQSRQKKSCWNRSDFYWISYWIWHCKYLVSRSLLSHWRHSQCFFSGSWSAWHKFGSADWDWMIETAKVGCWNVHDCDLDKLRWMLSKTQEFVLKISF